MVNKRKWELDTGSGLYVIPREDFERIWPNATLHTKDLNLRTYSGEVINPEREFVCKVKLQDQVESLELHVLEKGSRPLFKRESLSCLKLKWNEIKNMTVNPSSRIEQVEPLKKKYQAIFDTDKTEKMRKVTPKLTLKDNAIPKFVEARTVSYALIPRTEKELTN